MQEERAENEFEFEKLNQVTPPLPCCLPCLCEGTRRMLLIIGIYELKKKKSPDGAAPSFSPLPAPCSLEALLASFELKCSANF